MKYVIPNERLVKLMTDYLNDFMDNCEVSKFDSFITLSKWVRNNNIVNYNNLLEYNDILVEYDSSDGRLWIGTDIFRNFTNWFPIHPIDAEEFIKDWFENTFDVEVSRTRVS